MRQGGTGRHHDETSVSSFLIRRVADVELFEGFQHNWVSHSRLVLLYAVPCLHALSSSSMSR